MIQICFGQRPRLKQYYHWINQAELAICDSNYLKASSCYDKAFRCHNPFSHDVLNAFTLNLKLIENEDRALRCFYYLAKMGDDPNWYVDDTVKYQTLWEKMKIITDTTSKSVDEELSDTINSIFRSDQEIRKICFNDEVEAEKQILFVDSCNWIALQNLYSKYSIINEYTCGIIPLRPAFSYHLCREFGIEPKQFFLQEVLKGNINASLYAHVEDNCFEILSNATTPQTLYGTNVSYVYSIDSVLFIIEPNNLAEVTKNRKKIFLETWKDYVRKVIWQYTHNSEIILVTKVSVHSNSNQDEKKMNELKQAIDDKSIKGQYIEIPLKCRL